MTLKHHKITILSGDSFNSNTVELTKAINNNANVLKDLCLYVEQLELEIKGLRS